MKKRIVVLEPLGVDQNLVVNSLSNISNDYEVIYHDTRSEDPKILKERSKDANILVVSNIKIDEEVIGDNKDLEMICVAFTGVDLIDLEYAKANNIVVSNASGYATSGVVELTFGLIFALYRYIKVGDEYVRTQNTHHTLLGSEIENKKFGLVGMGPIGRKVALIANAFGADVYVYNRSKVDMDGITQVDIEEIFKTCDIVSIHLPLNNETRKTINKDLLDLMKSDSILINTARGPIIDNDYLAKLLNEGKIAGAGIDVFDMEPPIPSDYKLLDAPNTIFTPHVAYYTKEAMEKRFDIVVDNITGFVNGKPINEVI